MWSGRNRRRSLSSRRRRLMVAMESVQTTEDEVGQRESRVKQNECPSLCFNPSQRAVSSWRWLRRNIWSEPTMEEASTSSHELVRHSSQDSIEPELCALCLLPLPEQPLGICIGYHGRRVCTHYFHFTCIEKVQPRRCPQCRAEYLHCVLLPHIVFDTAAWARLISPNTTASLTCKEVCCALKATLNLPPTQVEEMVETSWRKCVNEQNQIEGRGLQEFMAPFKQLLPAAKPVACDLEHPLKGQPQDVDGLPECTCAYGMTQLCRGDRVQRGPGWYGEDDGGVGSLGTVVSGSERSGEVVVQWDFLEFGNLRSYAFPTDIRRHEVMYASYRNIPFHVRVVQAMTGLSSIATFELMRRVGFAPMHITVDAFRHAGDTISELTFRKIPAVSSRCRILPDEKHVQRWFADCSCHNPAVFWTGEAARHLGREGYVLKNDDQDKTVLVQLVDRCNCKVWYPKLAVEAVFDPDMPGGTCSAPVNGVEPECFRL